jgi:hypothetical protein
MDCITHFQTVSKRYDFRKAILQLFPLQILSVLTEQVICGLYHFDTILHKNWSVWFTEESNATQ